MTTRTFTLNTEPHEAVVGGVTLLFEPEASGADFVEAYTSLRDAQKRVSGTKASSTRHAKAEDVDPESLANLTRTMREFIRRFLLTASQPDFDALKLPDRVLIQMVEYVAELYGSGSGNPAADGGTSAD